MTNTLRISCRLENLKTIRQFVHDALSAYGIDQKCINHLVLCVDEISANSIIHSCRQDESLMLEININYHKEQETIAVDIIDPGQSINFSLPALPTIQDIIKNKKKGGMGLMLVMKMIDKIEYKSTQEPHRNICTLYKKIKTA
jgi:serine/threonine-protein kinase RsbW